MSRRFPAGLIAVASCALAVVAATSAQAATGAPSASYWLSPTAASASTPVPGWRLAPRQVVAIAERLPEVRQLLVRDRGLTPAIRALGQERLWEVLWARGSTWLAIAYLDDSTGRVTELGTGIEARLATIIPLYAWDTATRIPGQPLTSQEIIGLALRSSKLRAALRSHPGVVPAAWLSGRQSEWRIDWFRGMHDEILVSFDPSTRTVVGVWTGRALTWALGRGIPIYTGDALGSWYVWIPLCLLFLLPFLDPRQPLRLLHFDLVALLGFSASTFFFDRGDLSASVPLIYPVLGYLFVRLFLAGMRPRARQGELVPLASERLLIVGIVALTVATIVLNVTDSVPLDVGTASYTGAQQMLHGFSPYDGVLGHLVPGGDTYGPVTYLAYVPFALAFPSAQGIAYPGAHVAAIAYDLLTALALLLLGLRLRSGSQGRVLGLALAYAWVAFPYTAFTLMENTNDALVALLVALTLLVLTSPGRRGAVLALAGMTKFSPFVLVPLIATGIRRPTRHALFVFAAGFAGTALVTVLPFAHSLSALHSIYTRTLSYQLHRTSPLSIWGQFPKLAVLQHVLEAGTVLLALSLAWVPRLRSHAQLAALSACLIIATEFCASYWYYTYIVWFAPAAFVALFLQYRLSRPEPAVAIAPEKEEVPEQALAGAVA